ncbi:hypothetical protein QYF36_020266 [Acer negundo]|nr:hypothetical protein QYF36_020266 [Acer negundo]
MPRHQRAWHARAKAPARLACPCQGTGALGMPVPRHRRAWHARAKAPARLACPCQGTSALGMPMPRHQRAWHAHAKAPARLACPCQGTSALGVLHQGTAPPTPRHQYARVVPLPRHQRARCALAKAPTRAACPCQGTTVWPGWRGHPMGAIRLTAHSETRLAPWSTILGCYLPSQRSHFKDIHTRHPPLGLCMRECLSVVGSVESHLAPLGKWMDGSRLDLVTW